jgi:hypothetical protein
MKGKIVGMKKRVVKNGPKSLHKTSKQVGKTKVMQKFVSNKGEFKCMLNYSIMDELRDFKMTKNLSYQDLIVRMLEAYKKELEVLDKQAQKDKKSQSFAKQQLKNLKLGDEI